MHYFKVLILVEPSGPLNLGSVARLCENFGINELRLVSPRCSPKDPEAIRMAVKGRNILDNSKQFASLIEAITDCKKVIATSGRKSKDEVCNTRSERSLSWLTNSSSSDTVGIVFGREDRGLSNDELQLANQVITIDTSPVYSSLNLSHAVAIILHELHEQEKKIRINDSIIDHISHQNASPAQLNDCIKDIQALLLEVGFILEHTTNARMRKIKSFLKRAEIRPKEVTFIRGISRQIRWALRKNNT